MSGKRQMHKGKKRRHHQEAQSNRLWMNRARILRRTKRVNKKSKKEG